MTDQEPRCPKCAAREEDIAIFKSFGGYWRKVCTKCGHEIDSGREEMSA